MHGVAVLDHGAAYHLWDRNGTLHATFRATEDEIGASKFTANAGVDRQVGLVAVGKVSSGQSSWSRRTK